MKRSLSLLFALVVITLIGGMVYVQAAGSKLLSVQSGSMAPNIRKGDLVIVKSVPVSRLKSGDIITFINPSNQRSTVTHRIVELPSPNNGQKLLTKGDANLSADLPVDKRTVLGKVTASVPYAGNAIDFVHRPLGLILIIYIPALMMVASELKRLIAYYRAQQPYRFAGYNAHQPPRQTRRATGIAAAMFCIVLSLGIVVPVKAALVSNSVTLANSSFSVGPIAPPPACSSSNNNSITINTGTNQTATSGNASTNNTTTGGSVTSGNASNTNSTNISVTITNC